MTWVQQYRKRPMSVRAIQWDGRNTQQVLEFCHKAEDGGEFLLIPTLEGVMRASKGDFIIEGIQGECYPCKPDIFHQTYVVDD